MKRILTGLVAVLMILVFVPLSTAAAPTPAIQPNGTVLFMHIGSTSVQVVDANSSPVESYDTTLDAAPVYKNGEVYLNSLAMMQVVSLYGGTAYAIGKALSFTVDGTTTMAFVGSTWAIQVTNNKEVVPISLFDASYTQGGVSYWPINLLFWFQFNGVGINETSVDQRNSEFLIYPYTMSNGKG